MKMSVGLVVVFTVAVAGAAGAQPPDPEPRLELSAGAAATRAFIIEDRSYGTALDLAAAGAWRLGRAVWLELEASRLFGLDARAAPCGLVDRACVGDGRDGFTGATAGSLTLTYRFRQRRVQMLAGGGIDVVRTTAVSTVTFASTGEQIETSREETGWGPTAVFGVLIPISSGWAVRPQFQVYGADRQNLTLIRSGVSLVRRW